MPKKSKAKQSKPKPAPPPTFEPTIPQQSLFAVDDLQNEPAQAPSPAPDPLIEPDFDPEPFLIEADFEPSLEPEPQSQPVRELPSPSEFPIPSRREDKQPSPARYDYRSPPKPAPIQRLASHKRPHSLPTSRLSPPPDVETFSQTAFGTYPHVVACISCDNCALLTNKHVFNRTKLGLHPTNTDTFIPITCSDCEDDRAKYWLQLSHDISPSPRRNQYPGTVSTKMLRSWFVFRDMKHRFDVSFDEREGPYKRVTRARDWWREGVLTESETVRLYFWQPNPRANGMGEEMVEVERRRDLFFGQFVHPKEKF